MDNKMDKPIKHTSSRNMRGDMKIGNIKNKRQLFGINKKEFFAIL